MKVIIIDDEPNCRIILRNYLTDYCPNVQVLGEADGVSTGEEIIRNMKPDIVLLDISMRDGTGFNLLERFKEIDFKVIFATALNNHAIKAFQYSASYYILKPIDPEELVIAIKRASEQIEHYGLTTKNFKKGFSEGNFNKLTIRTEQRYYNLEFEHIYYLEADGNYTTFHLNDGKKIITSKKIKEYDAILISKGFFRVHKSYIANLNVVTFFNNSANTLHLKNEVLLPVSRRNKRAFLEMFNPDKNIRS